MRILIATIVPLLTISLAACQPKIAANDYFPLQRGITWHYQVSEDLNGQSRSRQFSIENIGNKTFDGKYFDMPVTVRRTSYGTDYYILDAEDGRFRIAKRTLVDSQPVLDEKELKVLPHFDNIAVGHNWFAESRTYTLQGMQNDTVPDAEDIQFSMEYEIVSTNDSIQVPAGKYENCVRVEGNATFTLYVDPMLGYQDINIQHTEWYAPAVGLVKLVREEPKAIGLFKGGTISFELHRMEI